jgi:hypothetical protein
MLSFEIEVTSDIYFNSYFFFNFSNMKDTPTWEVFTENLSPSLTG